MPVPPADDALARLLVERKLVTAAQLELCRAEQEEARCLGLTSFPIGAVAAANGFLPAEQLQLLLEQEGASLPAADLEGLRRNDVAFGRRVVGEGLVTRERLRASIQVLARLQEVTGLPVRLGELLAVQGDLTLQDVARLSAAPRAAR
ncbi:MAG: hypothetical protein HYZ53_23025 [Planctomycetes bacterium]|nr:hypothetical protein [Planctomycetota bacterium]